MKQREDRRYQMTSCNEFLPCVPLCFLSSYVKSLYNIFFFELIRKSTMRRGVFRQLHI